MEMNQEQQAPVATQEKAVLKIGKLTISKKIAIIAGASLAVLIGAGVASYFVFFSSSWVAKINGEKITLKEFNSLYYAKLRSEGYSGLSNEEIDKIAADPMKSAQNPYLKRTEFLNQMMDGYIVYQLAVKEGYLKNEEVKMLSEYNRYSIATRFHAEKLFKDKVTVTDKEISDVYARYKAQLQNRPLEEVKDLIKKEIIPQKISMEQNKKYQELKDAATIDRASDDVFNKLSDPDKTKRPTSGDVVTIKGKNIATKTVSVKEFMAGYYAQLKYLYKTDEAGIDRLANDASAVSQNPILNKKTFLDQIVGSYLFYEDARISGTLKDPDFDAIAKFYDMNIAVSYFLKDKYSKDVEVTQKEISDTYNAMRKQIPPNVTPDQAEAYIKQNLEQQKLAQKLPSIVSGLRDKAEKEKNLDVLEVKSSKK
jgi:hypothetical protein